jgi:hypothetical protein
MSEFPVNIVCLVIFLVWIFYTSVGGMKAIMWTDTFQVRTPQSLRLTGVRVPGGYILPSHLPGAQLKKAVKSTENKQGHLFLNLQFISLSIVAWILNIGPA